MPFGYVAHAMLVFVYDLPPKDLAESGVFRNKQPAIIEFHSI
jgi:hypothetical protein